MTSKKSPESTVAEATSFVTDAAKTAAEMWRDLAFKAMDEGQAAFAKSFGEASRMMTEVNQLGLDQMKAAEKTTAATFDGFRRMVQG